MDELNGRAAASARDLRGEVGPTPQPPAAVVPARSETLLFFDLLRDHNAEFGFRVANEAARFLHFYRLLGGYPDDNTDWFNAAMDAVIVQVLPSSTARARSSKVCCGHWRGRAEPRALAMLPLFLRSAARLAAHRRKRDSAPRSS